MKSRVLKTSIGSTLFLLLIIIVLALVRPVYERLSASMSELETKLYDEVKQKTGLTLSYKSLSPSILSAINIKGIVLQDAVNGDVLLEIRRATLSYSFFDFFSSDKDKVLKSLVVEGITFEYNDLTDKELYEKFINYFSKQNEKSSAKKRNDAFKIPFDVFLKNVSVHYIDNVHDALIFLNYVNLKENRSIDFMNVDGNGKLVYYNDKIRSNDKKSRIGCNFNFSSLVSSVFRGSSASVHLSSSASADYTVSKLDMLFNYDDSVLSFRTVRSLFPFSLLIEADLEEKKGMIAAKMDGFDPFDLVVIKQKKEFLKKIAGSKIYGGFKVDLARDYINYDVDASFNLAEKIAGKPFSLACDFDGNLQSVNVSLLKASGDFIDASFEGSCDFKSMQPEGILQIDKFVLNNGCSLSSEVYIDPYNNGFMCFAPQLYINEKVFTALQFNLEPENESWDFSFEMDDYAHYTYDRAGHIRIDGSLLTGAKMFLQAQVNVSDIFGDSIADTLSCFTKAGNGLKKIKSIAEPFIVSNEMYVSTDFSDFSINIPFCVIANTERDRQIVVFSADGSKETLQISNFEMQYENQSATASIAFDFSHGLKDFSFTSDCSVNSIPYSLSGNMSSSWLSVAGDYGFNFSMLFGDGIDGSIQLENMPVAFGDYIFSFSTNTSFVKDRNAGYVFNIYECDIAEASGLYAFNPKLTFNGVLNSYGFFMDTISYSDNISVLDGNGNFLWNINDGIFDSIHADLNCYSPLTTEKISIDANISNPDRLELTKTNLFENFYLSIQSDINSFNISRFSKTVPNEDYTVTAELAVTGNVGSPYVSLNVSRLVTEVLGTTLVSKGLLTVDDISVNLSDFEAEWAGLSLKNCDVHFMPENFQTDVKGDLSGGGNKYSFTMPVNISVGALSAVEKWAVPENFIVNVKSDKVSGGFIHDKLQLDITGLYSPGRFDLFSDSYESLAGVITSDGNISLSIGDSSPVSFNISGQIKNNTLDIFLSKLNVDLGIVCSKIDIPYVTFSSGIASGDVHIGGLVTDPEFDGGVTVTKPVFNVPYVSDKLFKGEIVEATLSQGLISVGDTLFILDKDAVNVKADFIFNRWGIDEIACYFNTPIYSSIPVNMFFPYIHYRGKGEVDLYLSYQPSRDKLVLSGDIKAENSTVDIVTSSLQSQLSSEDLSGSVVDNDNSDSDLSLDMNLRFIVGSKVQITVNPFLRGVIVPDTPLSLVINSDTGDFLFKGDIQLRGGEIAWLNRNFYLKEGRITFNETQNAIDPKINVRAETRERDESGNQVTVILSCANQFLSQFRPVLSATPAKSEAEIMELLGNFITADSDSVASFAMAGGDYFVQTMVMRRIENSLRELCNFDIFSIRANILQNALKRSIDQDSNNNQMTFGNFFDNSTVYIGKYFGSAMYFDALLNWSYDEAKSQDTSGGLVLQPEFGLEMASPFVNIRLGVAPDFEAIQKKEWMPSTSVTLSWKYNF